MTIPASRYQRIVSELRRQERRRPGPLYRDTKLRRLHKIRNPGWWLVRCACWAHAREGLNYVQLAIIFYPITIRCLQNWCFRAEVKGLVSKSNNNPKTFYPL